MLTIADTMYCIKAHIISESNTYTITALRWPCKISKQENTYKG